MPQFTEYLVTEQDGTTHLPVPDRDHAGKAWAALHDGFMGQHYEGPDKEGAIRRLTALYKKHGWPLPDAEDDSPHAHAEAHRPARHAPDDDDSDAPEDDPETDDEDEGPDDQPEEDSEEGRPARRQHDEPSSTDVHLDAALGADEPPEGRADIPPPRKRKRAHYWNHVRDHVKQAMAARGQVKPDDLDAIFKDAHKHATAMGKRDAARERQQSYADADDGLLTGDDTTMPGGWQPCAACKKGDDGNCTCGACKSGNTESCWCDKAMGKKKHASAYVESENGEPFTLYMPFAFKEPPPWLGYLPRPGNYKHDRYGVIRITQERNQNFVRNFNAGVYQTDAEGKPAVPVDGEHQPKVSGAMGWIQELRMNQDGGVDARVSWTDRGRKMLDEDRYKFFSPEIYDSWNDPLTGKSIKDVAIGGALTTRPYFKSNAQGQALRPLIASEAGIQVPDEDTAPVPLWAGEETRPPTGQEEAPMSTPVPASVQLTEDQYNEFLSFRERASQAEQEAIRATEEARRANERAGALEHERQRRIFTEEAIERNVDAQGYVELMEMFDPDQRDALRAFIDPIIVQRNEGGLFSELGRSDRGVSANATDRMMAKVKHLQEKTPSLRFDEAVGQIARTEPHLFAEYQEEARNPVRRH